MLPRYPRQNTKSVKPLCAYNFMMCQRIGLPPISTKGLGRYSVSSRRRVPSPPQSITTFTKFSWTALVLSLLDFRSYTRCVDRVEQTQPKGGVHVHFQSASGERSGAVAAVIPGKL